MAKGKHRRGMISATGRFRWLDASIGKRQIKRLARLDRARKPELSAAFARNGQILAGTGALVFEGELLELPRRR